MDINCIFPKGKKNQKGLVSPTQKESERDRIKRYREKGEGMKV